MRRMENTKKMYVTATEAAELLGVSNGYAYKLQMRWVSVSIFSWISTLKPVI